MKLAGSLVGAEILGTAGAAAGKIVATLILGVSDIREKIASGKFEDITAPNVFKDGNYLKLRNNHPFLEKVSMAALFTALAILVCAGIGFSLQKFYGA